MSTDQVFKAVGAVLFPQFALLEAATKLTAKAFEEKKPVSELREMAERQELQLRMAEAQAKIAQELAIARKIETALDVEMEEFYEYVGGGSGGIQGNLKTGDIGFNASAEVRRVNKRIYRFRGEVASS